MTTCAIVLGIISCTVDPGTRVAPAEAASLLAPHQFVAVAQEQPGPVVATTGSSPSAGPFGEFREFSEPRRLDGSLVSDPPWQAVARGGRGRAAGSGGVRGRASRQGSRRGQSGTNGATR